MIESQGGLGLMFWDFDGAQITVLLPVQSQAFFKALLLYDALAGTMNPLLFFPMSMCNLSMAV